MGGAGEVDRIEKAPELAQWLEKIQQLPDGESPAAGSISGIDPDSWGPEDEQRIQQMIERILEEGI
jgi:hypothetical protein